MTGEMIGAYAALSRDFFEVHIDDDFARGLGFPARIAHGLLVLALTDGMKNNAAPTLQAVASLGWDWCFLKPVLVGDTIRATLTVVAIDPPRRPDRGAVTLRLDVTNQDGTIVQQGTNRLLMRGRAGDTILGC